MKGTVNDLGDVSLIGCERKLIRVSRIPDAGGKRVYYAVFSLDCVVFGTDVSEHFSPGEETVDEASFLSDDANVLFHDPDVFAAAVFYYTGRNQVFEVDTSLGNISARRETYLSTGPDGARMDNRTYVHLRFAEAVNYRDAVGGTEKILRFLELLAGRPQNLENLLLRKRAASGGEPETRRFRVYARRFYGRERLESEVKPEPLVDPVGNPEEFKRVMSGWLERYEARSEARDRFSGCFAKRSLYDVDRLVAVANMFDLLPPEAVSSGRPGRKITLKEKVVRRARRIKELIGDKIPDFDMVTEEAVNCRNRYVHGDSDRARAYCDEESARVFLTNTLEFAFAASDLVEAGWNIRTFIEAEKTISHPFLGYLKGYEENLKKLKDGLPGK